MTPLASPALHLFLTYKKTIQVVVSNTPCVLCTAHLSPGRVHDKEAKACFNNNVYCFLVCINKLGISLDYDMTQTLLLAL